MFVLAALALLQGSTPALPEHRIANIFKPLATPAASEYAIAVFVLAITGAIFVVVAGLIIYTIVRFRAALMTRRARNRLRSTEAIKSKLPGP